MFIMYIGNHIGTYQVTYVYMFLLFCEYAVSKYIALFLGDNIFFAFCTDWLWSPSISIGRSMTVENEDNSKKTLKTRKI